MVTKTKCEVFSINLPFEQTKTGFIIIKLKQVFYKCFSFYSVFKLQLLSDLLARRQHRLILCSSYAYFATKFQSMIPVKQGRETRCQGTCGSRLDIHITSTNQLSTRKILLILMNFSKSQV